MALNAAFGVGHGVSLLEHAVLARVLGEECLQHYSVYAPQTITGPIEAGICPLVDALNSMDGVRTFASCEGHVKGWLPPRTHRSPYVLFMARPAMAGLLAKAFFLDGMQQYGGAGGGWSVTASLNPALRWQWTLRGDGIGPRDYRRACSSAAVLVEKLAESLKCVPEETGLHEFQPERCYEDHNDAC